MSSIVTRTLGKADQFDRQAVRVDSAAFADKTGIIVVTVTSIVAAVAGGTVDIRVPNYNAANDDVVYNDVPSVGTTTISKKVYIAVNKGIPGPSVKTNPDLTWDLLWLTLSLPDGNTLSGVTATLNYTVETFIDLTPSTSNPTTGNGTLTLNVAAGQGSDTAEIGVSNSSIGTASGYVKAWINQATSTLVPDVGAVPAAFSVAAPQQGSGCGCHGDYGMTMIRHSLPTVAGTKVYSQGMFVFAVNNGKIDGNGYSEKGTNSQSVALECKLESPLNPISLSVSYNTSFQAL